MKKAIKRIIATLSITALFAVPILAPSMAYAQASTDCGGITGCLTNGADSVDPGKADNATDRVNGIIKLVINVFSLVVGVISVIMIIVGGLKYITSGGEAGNITGAKNTILYAIIGLVVVAMAQVIVKFVLEKAISTP